MAAFRAVFSEFHSLVAAVDANNVVLKALGMKHSAEQLNGPVAKGGHKQHGQVLDPTFNSANVPLSK